jgi:tetratricopeptide (TPR) repeat protein
MIKIISLAIGLLLSFCSLGQTSKDYYLKGVAKANIKDHIGAISDYTKAIELNSKLENVHFARAISKAELEDYRGAIADYNKDIQLTPKNPGAYFNRGIVKYFRLQDKDGGCLDWSKSGEQGFGDAYETIRKYCN